MLFQSVIKKNSSVVVSRVLGCRRHEIFFNSRTGGAGKLIKTFKEAIPLVFGVYGKAGFKASGNVENVAKIFTVFCGNKDTIFGIE